MLVMRFIFLVLLLPVTLYAESIHPRFRLSSNKLTAISQEYDIDDIKQFLSDIEKLLLTEYPDLRMVDKHNRLDSTYIPNDLINLSDYDLHTRYKTMLFSQKAVNDFLKMSNDAKNQGIDIFIASTYRSWQFQNEIFNNMKNYHGEEKAATIVAYPGASQHQLGTAVDFGNIKPSYAYSDAGKWLRENAWLYGFSLSYPQGMEEETTYMWEPWHFRYIGKEAAYIEQRYFGGIQHYFIQFWNKYKILFIDSFID